MRLGFDLDGTLADLQTALAREARSLFPTVDPSTLPSSAAPGDRPAAADDDAQPPQVSVHGLRPREERELWRAVCERVNFWETLEEIEPGAVARLSALANERKWEIIFLTSRPETRGDNAQAQSHRWLSAHGFGTPSVFVVHGSRGKIAAALQLDVVVDDRPDNCLDVCADSPARPILIWRGDERNLPSNARHLGIGVVPSIGRCLDVLEKLDDQGGQDPSLLKRLRRLLGLKGRAARSREHKVEEPLPASSSSQ
jgi:hypothetical protein